MNPLNDRTPEEMLPRNKNVVTFLHHVTTPQDASDDIQAQSIARVRSRLLQEGQLEMEDVAHPATRLVAHNRIHQEKERDTALAHKRPIWQQRFTLLVAVLCVALLVSSFVAVEQIGRHRSTTTSPGTSGSSHKTITIHMAITDFVQHTVVLHKGMRLLLIADKGVQHIIVNGYWKNRSQQVILEERGIPDVDFSIVDSKIIGPFNVAGTYHLYDTIHVGMNLVVIVKK